MLVRDCRRCRALGGSLSCEGRKTIYLNQMSCIQETVYSDAKATTSMLNLTIVTFRFQLHQLIRSIKGSHRQKGYRTIPSEPRKFDAQVFA